MTDDTEEPRYAWCFSHGRLHTFKGKAWCTAFWVPLPGFDEQHAIATKTSRYGAARFIHELPLDQRVIVMGYHREER